MTAPYYEGDGVPLKFTVSDADGAVNPVSCDVYILKPHNTVVEAEPAIDGNKVSYNVPGTTTDTGGHYKVYFIMTLPSGLERTHKIEFDVRVNPEENR